MACKITKKEKSKAKDERQSQAPDNPVGAPKRPKVKKPWRLMCKYVGESRWMGELMKEWFQHGKYETEDQAKQALDAVSSSGLPYEFDIRYKE